MVENGRGGEAPHEQPPGEEPLVQRSKGSGVIFALVAIALILAIGFFYLTKNREDAQNRAVTQAVDSVDSAAQVVGNAAQNAVNDFERN